MALAITASELEDAAATIAGLVLPAEATTARLEAIITRKTAITLQLRGLNALPSDAQELSIVQDGVLRFSLIDLKKSLRPDDSEFLRALDAEEKLLRSNLAVVKDQGVGARFFEVI